MNGIRGENETLRKHTHSFSNYNWNVQPTNTIYQDSENCSHEKNKYHFNFTRTTSNSVVYVYGWRLHLPSLANSMYIFLIFFSYFICCCIFAIFFIWRALRARKSFYSCLLVFIRNRMRFPLEMLSIRTGWLWQRYFFPFLLTIATVTLSRN